MYIWTELWGQIFNLNLIDYYEIMTMKTLTKRQFRQFYGVNIFKKMILKCRKCAKVLTLQEKLGKAI